MSFAKLLAENSALANAVDLVGDKWSLMILSGCFSSVRRFNGFEKNLGINRNLLSARLDKLVKAGVLEKKLYQEKPARYEYIITEIGRELRPVLVALASWSEKHLVEGPSPVSIVHDHCDSKIEILLHCGSCERVLEQTEVISRLNPDSGGKAERAHDETRGPVVNDLSGFYFLQFICKTF